MTVKPQLAEDAILDQVKFPCIVQPKIDGVRALDLQRAHGAQPEAVRRVRHHGVL